MSQNVGSLEFYYDDLIIERDRYRILSNILRTDKTFYFDGWFVKSCEAEVKALLDKYGCYYEITMPEKGESMPILLKQNSITDSVFGAVLFYIFRPYAFRRCVRTDTYGRVVYVA